MWPQKKTADINESAQRCGSPTREKLKHDHVSFRVSSHAAYRTLTSPEMQNAGSQMTPAQRTRVRLRQTSAGAGPRALSPAERIGETPIDSAADAIEPPRTNASCSVDATRPAVRHSATDCAAVNGFSCASSAIVSTAGRCEPTHVHPPTNGGAASVLPKFAPVANTPCGTKQTVACCWGREPYLRARRA